MRVVRGKRVDNERRAEVSERADLLFWPGDDGQATENRDFNSLFGDLEPFSDRLTRERLVPLDGRLNVAGKSYDSPSEKVDVGQKIRS